MSSSTFSFCRWEEGGTGRGEVSPWVTQQVESRRNMDDLCPTFPKLLYFSTQAPKQQVLVNTSHFIFASKEYLVGEGPVQGGQGRRLQVRTGHTPREGLGPWIPMGKGASNACMVYNRYLSDIINSIFPKFNIAQRGKSFCLVNPSCRTVSASRPDLIAARETTRKTRFSLSL